MTEVIVMESAAYQKMMGQIAKIAEFITKNEHKLQDCDFDNDVWLDSQEVADMLHISTRTLQRLRSDGLVEYSVFRRKCLYKLSEIEKKVREKVITCVLSVHAQGIPMLKNLPLAELPKEISYKGEFLSCTVWTDKLGENYLITSQSPVHQEELPEGTPISSKELYARHYIKEGKHFSVLWQLYDFLKDGYCGMFTVDYLCKPYVNDFDRDGICETWLVYQLGCRSDFSRPLLTMKIIMHSGNKKYAIRGERDMLFPQSYGISSKLGKFQMDDNYRTLPESVRNFGIVLWHKFQVEDLEYLME